MSGNAQQDYVTSILTLLAQQQFLPGDMTLDDKAKFEADLKARADALLTHYENERQATAQLPADDPRRKAFDDATVSLAKALPSIAKGTLDAISAFQRGDAITGSAAVMDICAALAPLLGALSAAGGPPGMLIGALFALIGMILSFFAPKSESLTAQMEKLLRALEAEEGLQDIHAAHQNITNYAAALTTVTSKIDSTLDATGELQAKVLTQIIADLNPIDGPTMTLFWEVAEWLQEPKNQDVDLWPTVLGGVCQAYTELLTAVIKLMSLVSTDAMQKRFDEADKLSPEDRHDVREALINLQAVTIARLTEFGACGDAQLGYLQRAVPAAQDRGRMWAIDDSAKQHLWDCTSIRLGGFTYLGGEAKRISMAETRQELGSPDPTFHGFALEPWIDQGYSGYDRTFHLVVNPPYDSMQSTQVDNDAFSLHALTDIWATMGTAGNSETDILFYVARTPTFAD